MKSKILWLNNWKTLQQSDGYEHRAAKALNTTLIMRLFTLKFCTEMDITAGTVDKEKVNLFVLFLLSSSLVSSKPTIAEPLVYKALKPRWRCRE